MVAWCVRVIHAMIEKEKKKKWYRPTRSRQVLFLSLSLFLDYCCCFVVVVVTCERLRKQIRETRWHSSFFISFFYLSSAGWWTTHQRFGAILQKKRITFTVNVHGDTMRWKTPPVGNRLYSNHTKISMANSKWRSLTTEVHHHYTTPALLFVSI
jgi:hypothetical protein